MSYIKDREMKKKKEKKKKKKKNWQCGFTELRNCSDFISTVQQEINNISSNI
jgi:hypothetical protein